MVIPLVISMTEDVVLVMINIYHILLVSLVVVCCLVGIGLLILA